MFFPDGSDPAFWQEVFRGMLLLCDTYGRGVYNDHMRSDTICANVLTFITRGLQGRAMHSFSLVAAAVNLP